MKFYMDRDVSSPLIVEFARELGLDLKLTTRANEEDSDSEQLARAAAEDRVIVTRNIDDFSVCTAAFHDSGWPHAGVLFVTWNVRKHQWVAFVAALARFAGAHPEGLQPYECAYLNQRDLLDATRE